MNPNKINLFAKLTLGYITLLTIAVGIYLFIIYIETDTNAISTKGSIITNLLVWTATLYTPIAAYLFYDSWKEQHNKKIISERAIKIWNNLDKITQELGSNVNIELYPNLFSDEKILDLDKESINKAHDFTEILIEVSIDTQLIEAILNENIFQDFNHLIFYNGNDKITNQHILNTYFDKFKILENSIKKELKPLIKA